MSFQNGSLASQYALLKTNMKSLLCHIWSISSGVDIYTLVGSCFVCDGFFEIGYGLVFVFEGGVEHFTMFVISIIVRIVFDIFDFKARF